MAYTDDHTGTSSQLFRILRSGPQSKTFDIYNMSHICDISQAGKCFKQLDFVVLLLQVLVIWFMP